MANCAIFVGLALIAMINTIDGDRAQLPLCRAKCDTSPNSCSTCCGEELIRYPTDFVGASCHVDGCWCEMTHPLELIQSNTQLIRGRARRDVWETAEKWLCLSPDLVSVLGDSEGLVRWAGRSLKVARFFRSMAPHMAPITVYCGYKDFTTA